VGWGAVALLRASAPETNRSWRPAPGRRGGRERDQMRRL